MDKLLGSFVWHELMTSDKDSAAGFFAKVAGWKTEGTPVDPNYRLFMRGGDRVAGLMDIPEEAKAMGARPAWMTYMGTPDIDGLAHQAESLGAKVLRPPSDIPTIGRFAVIQDPQGAVFLGFTPAPMEGMAPPKPAFVWHELLTTDVEAAFDFYHRLFGWVKTEAMNMEPIGVYQMYGSAPGQSMGGIFKLPAGMQAPPHWLPYIGVADARKVASATEQAGGTITLPPMKVPDGGWITNGMDLQGAAFAVYSEAEKASPAVKTAPAKTTPAKTTPAKTAPAKAAAKPAAKKAAKKPAKAAAAKKPAKKGPVKVAKKPAKAAKKGAAKKPVKKAAAKKAGKKVATKRAATRPAKKKARRAGR
jgi:predicted enzyme related to lactoylglutathione lyase